MCAEQFPVAVTQRARRDERYWGRPSFLAFGPIGHQWGPNGIINTQQIASKPYVACGSVIRARIMEGLQLVAVAVGFGYKG